MDLPPYNCHHFRERTDNLFHEDNGLRIHYEFPLYILQQNLPIRIDLSSQMHFYGSIYENHAR